METIEYRVTFESGDAEQVTVTAGNQSACIREAVRVSKRFDRDTGKRDHIVSVEFWERRTEVTA
jgi:hypothetical protein